MLSPDTLNKKGWFIAGGRDGDRTLEQQLTGLTPLFESVAGKTVLDAGCAEGLIAIELARYGAKACVGLEVVEGHVEVARELAAGLPCEFHQANLNDFDVGQLGEFDVVLMLAILHKLRDPSKVCTALAAVARELCVIRLPPTGPVIKDPRSFWTLHDIITVMQSAGFYLEQTQSGPFQEWMGYFRRQRQPGA